MPDLFLPRRAPPLPTPNWSHRRVGGVDYWPRAGAGGAAWRGCAADDPTRGAPVGWGSFSLYVLAYMGTCLLFLAPLLVTAGLEIKLDLVGNRTGPDQLGAGHRDRRPAVTGRQSVFLIAAGMSDARRRRWGCEGPGWSSACWAAPSASSSSAGTQRPGCVAGMVHRQLFFNALARGPGRGAADQVPEVQRGLVAGALGVCLPIASVSGTFVVQLFTGNCDRYVLVPAGSAGSSSLFSP